jgi:hypothetical protein
LSEESTIDGLKRKGWVLADSQRHPLGSLQGKRVDSYELVVLLGRKNRFGATCFQVFLQNEAGQVSQQSVAIGLHNQGKYPGYNWFEIISFSSSASFGSGEEASHISISLVGSTQQLFQYLADLIPPGGHMMFEYDSPEHQDTARSLALGIPPAATRLGHLLFSIGCGAGFRDWYFAEGGAEGPRKIQGYKALNGQHAQLKAKEPEQELNTFLGLSLSEGSELVRAARQRALTILNMLKRNNEGRSI